MPLRDIPPGEYMYCPHCDHLLHWQNNEWRWAECRNCGMGHGSLLYISTSSFSNPLQDYYNTVNVRQSGMMLSLVSHHCRTATIASHSFAVSDDRSINKISSLGNVVEMGAGRGYWA